MTRLAHHVYFSLKDRDEKSVDDFVTICKKYLDNHDGLVGFEVGKHVPDLAREVNQQYDVSLHCIFADRAAHDTYQTAERHLKFIEETKPNWADVRVCDSYLT